MTDLEAVGLGLCGKAPNPSHQTLGKMNWLQIDYPFPGRNAGFPLTALGSNERNLLLDQHKYNIGVFCYIEYVHIINLILK